MNLDFWNDKRKLKEVKKIIFSYGLKTTSTLLLAISILATSAGSKSYNEKKEEVSLPDNVSYSIEKPIVKKLGTEEQLVNYTTIEKELTYEEKVEKILDKFNLTREELDVCCAISIAEASCEGMNYEEATHVINTAYNRIICSRWVASLGDNLYEQMTAPNQFVVYQSGSYAKYLGQTDLPGYQAVIDFLSNTSEVLAHDYLAFRSNGSKIEGSVELTLGGNKYFSLLTEEERLEDFRVEEELMLVYHK